MNPSVSQPALRVLAGIDLTERSRNAFARAVELTRASGASLTLLHVVSDALPNAVASVHEKFAEEALRDLAARARADGVEVTTRLVRGRDYEGLIDEARETACDLAVIGTHRPSSFMQDMLGTTADRVIRNGSVPVLLVRKPPAGPYASILVAVDFSPASRRALEHAVRWFPQARIAAITAYTAPRHTFADDERGTAADMRHLALRGLLDEVRQRLGPSLAESAARIVPVVERGWPEDVIVHHAEETKSDLIVVGTHARAGLQQAILGSVAAWVLTEAPCDVLAIPPE